MVKLFSVREMQALEIEANDSGLTYEMMMENAGRGLAEEIISAYSHINTKVIFALVGSGNNGGDALVALSHLTLANWETYAYIVKNRSEDDRLVKEFVENGGKVVRIEEDDQFIRLTELLQTCQVLIDAVFGTGIKLPLKTEIANVLAFVKKHIERQADKIHVVAVDCPSGVDCETGAAADEVIPSEITVSMAGYKTGLIRFPAAKLAGEIFVSSIGPIDNLISYVDNQKIILTKQIIRKYLPERPIDAHKGIFGTALIIAGSVNYTGAAYLSGLAAYRSGAGLVTMAVPAPLHEALSGHLPEATWVLLPHELGAISPDAVRVVQLNVSRATAILIGPGFGLEDITKEFVIKLFSEANTRKPVKMGFIQSKLIENVEGILKKPMIVDADGLKLMSKIQDWADLFSTTAILTPHPGEMSVLTKLPTEEIQANRLEIAQEYSKKWGHIVVLKGAFTVIAAPNGQVAVVPIATAALASAGTGDVLAGLIVGLRAQGVEPFKAACAGAWIHATAGVLAAKNLGGTTSVIASDVLNAIPQIISEL